MYFDNTEVCEIKIANDNDDLDILLLDKNSNVLCKPSIKPINKSKNDKIVCINDCVYNDVFTDLVELGIISVPIGYVSDINFEYPLCKVNFDIIKEYNRRH